MRYSLTYKRAKMLASLAVSHLLYKRRPLNVYLAITNRCNLDCYYCYGDYPVRSNWREFTTEELLILFDELAARGTCLLQLQGGEPLMRKDIGILVDRVLKNGMICDLITNGILVEKRFDVIKKLDSICISLDGRKKINDRNRGEGTFEKIISAIELCSSNGIATRINAVLTGETEPEDLRFLAETARRTGSLLNFSLSFQYEPLKAGGPTHHLTIIDDQVRNFLHLIKQLQAEHYPIQFSDKAHDLALEWPFSYQKRMARADEVPGSYKYPKCFHADYIVFIDADGSVYPCCNFWGKPKWNIRKDGLDASLEGISREGCEACYILSYLDRNLIFGMRPRTLFHYAIRALREML